MFAIYTLLNDVYHVYQDCEVALADVVANYNAACPEGILRPHVALDLAMRNMARAQRHVELVFHQVEYLLMLETLISMATSRVAAAESGVVADVPEERNTAPPEETVEHNTTAPEETMEQNTAAIQGTVEVEHNTAAPQETVEYNAATPEETVLDALIASLNEAYENCESALAFMVETYEFFISYGFVDPYTAFIFAEGNALGAEYHFRCVNDVVKHFVMIAGLVAPLDPTAAQPVPVRPVVADLPAEHNAFATEETVEHNMTAPEEAVEHNTTTPEEAAEHKTTAPEEAVDKP